MLFFEKFVIYETYFSFDFIYSPSFILIIRFLNSLKFIIFLILRFANQILALTILEAAYF